MRSQLSQIDSLVLVSDTMVNIVYRVMYKNVKCEKKPPNLLFFSIWNWWNGESSVYHFTAYTFCMFCGEY